MTEGPVTRDELDEVKKKLRNVQQRNWASYLIIVMVLVGSTLIWQHFTTKIDLILGREQNTCQQRVTRAAANKKLLISGLPTPISKSDRRQLLLLPPVTCG